MSISKFKLSKWRSGGLEIAVEGKSGRTTTKDFKQYDKTRTRLTCWQEMPSGKVVTGLSKEDEAYYEEQLGINKTKYPQGLAANSTYWSENGVYITQDGLYLDEEIPSDSMWVKVLKARKDVATSTKVARETPSIEYILTNQDAEAEAKVERRDYLKKAMALLSEMSPEDLKNYLIMVNQYSVTMSPKVIEDKVGDIAESNPKAFLTMSNHPDKDTIVLIQELINNRIITNVGSTYYDSNKTQLAYSKDQMIGFIKNKENNGVVLGFKKQLSIAKKESK